MQTKSWIALGALIVITGCASQNGRMPGAGANNPPPGIGSQPGTAQGQSPRPSGPNQPSSNGPASSQASAAPKPPPNSASQVSSPAVMSLLNSADTLAKGGHMEASAATLERALDLEPRNPFIYQRLATVRLAEGQTGQAEQMAMKSNSLSNNNPFVESGNWQLIANARHTAGDKHGARQAKARAANYRQATSQYNQ